MAKRAGKAAVAGKSKPRFGESDRYHAWPDGWEFLYEPGLPVTDEQVAKIAAGLSAARDSEHVAAVLATIRRFHGREGALATLRPGDHRTRDIETLAALARAMDGLNLNVLASLARHGVDFGFCEAKHVAATARIAAEELERSHRPRRSGRKRKISRAVAFRDLAAIYTTATDRPARISTTSGSDITEAGQPSGPFFQFMRAAVAPVPGLEALSDHALAKAVKRSSTRT